MKIIISKKKIVKSFYVDNVYHHQLLKCMHASSFVVVVSFLVDEHLKTDILLISLSFENAVT